MASPCEHDMWYLCGCEIMENQIRMCKLWFTVVWRREGGRCIGLLGVNHSRKFVYHIICDLVFSWLLVTFSLLLFIIFYFCYLKKWHNCFFVFFEWYTPVDILVPMGLAMACKSHFLIGFIKLFILWFFLNLVFFFLFVLLFLIYIFYTSIIFWLFLMMFLTFDVQFIFFLTNSSLCREMKGILLVLFLTIL